MSWTIEKPTVSGWYWLKDGSAEIIVQVEIGTFDSYYIEWVWFAGSRRQTPLSAIKAQWAGPLEPPNDSAQDSDGKTSGKP